MLILQEPIRGSNSYTRLQIVPVELRDIIFVAFHSSLIDHQFLHQQAFRTDINATHCLVLLP